MDLIQLSLVDPNPYQPRLSLDPEALERLARGIKLKRETLPETFGLMQVPIARQVNGRYQLAFGHRRLEAFKHLYRTETIGSEWLKIPLQLVNLTDEEMYDFAARENGDREDINPIERARSIVEAQQKFGWELQRAASAHGLSKSAASNLTRLLQLPPSVQEWLRNGTISQRHGRELVRLVQCDEALATKCIDLGRECAGVDMSLNDLKNKVDDLIREQTNRQRVAQHIAGKTCPYCDAPIKLLHPTGFKFGCGVHNFGGLIDFDMEWRQREAREEEERRKEARQHEIHTRYCPRCNAPSQFNGQAIHDGKLANCPSCNIKNILYAWREKPLEYRPLNLEGDVIETTIKPACPFWTKIPGTAEKCYLCGKSAEYHNNGHTKWPGADLHLCQDHYWKHLDKVKDHSSAETLQAALEKLKSEYEQQYVKDEEIRVDGFPNICPTGKSVPRIAFNCAGCQYYRNTQRGTWFCFHPDHQAGQPPVFQENESELENQENEPEPERQVCEHCGKRPANVKGEPYCGECWHTELTDWLYCPRCDALSTIDKKTPTDQEITCWACKLVERKLAWCEHTDIRAMEKEKLNLQFSLKGRFQSILEAATLENLIIIEKVIIDMDKSIKQIKERQATA